MTIQEWSFSAFDTWFFREARPFNIATSNELASLFPPSPRTIMGAIRTCIGEQYNNGVDWVDFKEKDKYLELKKQIGDDSGEEPFGRLKITGSYLIYKEKRLYPVPAFLMEKTDKDDKNKKTFHRLVVAKKTIHCDLGEVFLPELENENGKGAKPLENAYLTHKGLQKILNWEIPDKDDIIKQNQLVEHETRTGIMRNNETRAVQEGKLYRTKHLRIIEPEQLKIGVLVKGLEQIPKIPSQMRFGGEGRMAYVNVDDYSNKNEMPKPTIPNKQHKQLFLMLLTSAYFNGSWIPCSFEEVKTDKQITWEGEINGIKLKIISAVVGKALHEGGWDLKNDCPRSVKSLVPAGSVYFCEVQNVDQAIEKLQGFKIGRETELGRGELAIGVWE